MAVPVTSPVTGVVGDVKVSVGQKVQKDEIIAVASVTKTEYQVKASSAGTIKSIVAKGANVAEGETIAEIDG